MHKVFIQSNKSQYLGALLGKYSIQRFNDSLPVEILLVEEIPEFIDFEGQTYKQGSEVRTFSLSDEQSFTLTRFMPPQQMNYAGRAIVIDPDVFAVQNVVPLFETDMQSKAVGCCIRKQPDFWDTSMMLLDNTKLSWNINSILSDLVEQKINYNSAIRKVFNEQIIEISRDWNSLDEINPDTRMLHMTRQRTQPWKTGLPFNVTRRNIGKIFGVIPKNLFGYGKEKYPKTYQEHPDESVKSFFFKLMHDALKEGAITKETVQENIELQRIRPDILEVIDQYAS